MPQTKGGNRGAGKEASSCAQLSTDTYSHIPDFAKELNVLPRMRIAHVLPKELNVLPKELNVLHEAEDETERP